MWTPLFPYSQSRDTPDAALVSDSRSSQSGGRSVWREKHWTATMAEKMEAEERASSAGVAPEPATAKPDKPGRRLLFNMMVDKFLAGLMDAGNYQRFASCYRRLYKMGPEMTRSIYEQFMAQLHSFINAEILELKEDGKLEVLLDSLDNLEREAGNNMEVQWRPSGVPEEDIRSHLVPYLLKQREYLRRLLKEKRQENARLAQSVLAGREKIEEMQREILRRQQAWQSVSQSQRDLLLSLHSSRDGI
ncbi:polyamine-modulated factor 1 isoform X2 [Phyllobates terribilis]|uniref:polyamine-modulated factor 1 isoform X2 n=1 Tax=Phyllobates terribilis TaxID=111132 RepID=UPI003CCB6BA9